MLGGSGFGLWITKVIVEHMGGKIQCKSTTGEASKFTINIPIDYYGTEKSDLPAEKKDLNNDEQEDNMNVSNRIKNLSDMAEELEGQKIVFILQSHEDVILLKERFKVFKNVEI